MRPDRDSRITKAQREAIRQLGERLRAVGRLRGDERGISAEAGEIVERIAAVAARGEDVDRAIAHAGYRIKALEAEARQIAERPWERAESIVNFLVLLFAFAALFLPAIPSLAPAEPEMADLMLMVGAGACFVATAGSEWIAKAVVWVVRWVLGSRRPPQLHSAN